MNDNTKDAPVIDDGFDRGDDNTLQMAMLHNLEKAYEEQVAQGDTEVAAHTREDIDALRAQMAIDLARDPGDAVPDDLSVH